MGTIIRSGKLVAAALLAATGVAYAATGPALAASQPVPFRVTISGTVQWTSASTVHFEGAGIAYLMGEVSNDGSAQITGYENGCYPNTHIEVLSAANGDTLTLTSLDVACPTAPGQVHGTGQWQVSGGTGRFAGASGSGSADGLTDFNSGTFAGTLQGWITLV